VSLAPGQRVRITKDLYGDPLCAVVAHAGEAGVIRGACAEGSCFDYWLVINLQMDDRPDTDCDSVPDVIGVHSHEIETA
jgi:hypothetical protein